MALSEIQFEKIVRYLNDELSPEEEAAFISEMAGNKELQQAFDIELILRQQQDTDEVLEPTLNSIQFEAADEHIRKVTNLIEPNETKQEVDKTTAPVIKLNRYKVISVAAAAAIAIFLIGITWFNNTQNGNAFADRKTTILPKDSITTKTDTPRILPKQTGDNPILIAENISLKSLGEKYYGRYKGSGNDPVELSLYLEQYANKKYDEVLKVTENDYATKGNSDDDELLKSYMLFYKALSYIETKRHEKAARALESVFREQKLQNDIYYDSQWYLLLAYLKLERKEKTNELLKVIIADRKNPNRQNALQIKKLIKAD